jgi:uncharacterized membrane protein
MENVGVSTDLRVAVTMDYIVLSTRILVQPSQGMKLAYVKVGST